MPCCSLHNTSLLQNKVYVGYMYLLHAFIGQGGFYTSLGRDCTGESIAVRPAATEISPRIRHEQDLKKKLTYNRPLNL